METPYTFSESELPTESWTTCLRSKNPIHELEVLPVLIAAELWGQTYAEAQVFYYIDNESSRMAYIRGDGETQRAAQMIHAFVQHESAMQHRVWFGRVPSCSSPADGPSRLDFKEVLKLGATKTSIDWELVMKHLELWHRAKGGRCWSHPRCPKKVCHHLLHSICQTFHVFEVYDFFCVNG